MENKVTINPRKPKPNDKNVRFDMEDGKDRRGKTPNHANNADKFMFQESSDEQPEVEMRQHNINSKPYNQGNMQEISMQYNQNRHSNSLLI